MNVAAILDAKGSDIVTIRPDSTLHAAARLLAERRIGSAVVTDGTDGPLLGIVSERDIVRAIARLGGAALDQRVSEFMSAPVETTERVELIRSIMERMTNGRFRHVPVVEEGRLVGIVSIGDVVKHRLAEIQAEASAMQEYIVSGGGPTVG